MSFSRKNGTSRKYLCQFRFYVFSFLGVLLIPVVEPMTQSSRVDPSTVVGWFGVTEMWVSTCSSAQP